MHFFVGRRSSARDKDVPELVVHVFDDICDGVDTFDDLLVVSYDDIVCLTEFINVNGEGLDIMYDLVIRKVIRETPLARFFFVFWVVVLTAVGVCTEFVGASGDIIFPRRELSRQCRTCACLARQIP